MSDWLVEREVDTAGRLHERSAGLVSGDPGSAGVPRRVRVQEVTSPAIVLGRAQPQDHVDPARAARAGVGVARRSSGGAAVLVEPGAAVWIDIVVPVGDRLWSPDVGRAMWWVGEAWAAALGDVGLAGAAVWHGSQQRGPWTDRVCFAGLGAGEVTLPIGTGRGAKVVGVAQRRTRRGALFQCFALSEWRPEDTLDVLALPEGRRREGPDELAGVATGVGNRVGALVEAVVQRVAAA